MPLAPSNPLGYLWYLVRGWLARSKTAEEQKRQDLYHAWKALNALEEKAEDGINEARSHLYTIFR